MGLVVSATFVPTGQRHYFGWKAGKIRLWIITREKCCCWRCRFACSDTPEWLFWSSSSHWGWEMRLENGHPSSLLWWETVTAVDLKDGFTAWCSASWTWWWWQPALLMGLWKWWHVEVEEMRIYSFKSYLARASAEVGQIRRRQARPGGEVSRLYQRKRRRNGPTSIPAPEYRSEYRIQPTGSSSVKRRGGAGNKDAETLWKPSAGNVTSTVSQTTAENQSRKIINTLNSLVNRKNTAD